MSFLKKFCSVGISAMRQRTVVHANVWNNKPAQRRVIHTAVPRLAADSQASTPVDNVKFDESMLKDLVCPLTKKPLKYDPERNELISEDIHAAYPIINGIPNLNPSDARKLEVEIDPEEEVIRHVKDRD